MRVRFLLMIGSVVLSLSFCGCSSSYDQAYVDALSSRYEDTISDLESQVEELNGQIAVLVAEKEEVPNVRTVPAGMSNDIYNYGVSLHKSCTDYLAGIISATDCYDSIKGYMADIILSDKSGLNQIDKNCVDNLTFNYSTMRRISKEDFSEYSLDDLNLALQLKIEELETILGY